MNLGKRDVWFVYLSLPVGGMIELSGVPESSGGKTVGAIAVRRAPLSDRMVQSKAYRLPKWISGGLKLCYLLMSSELIQMCRILFTCLRACWDWYTHHSKNIKSADQNLRYTVSLAGGIRVAGNMGPVEIATPDSFSRPHTGLDRH